MGSRSSAATLWTLAECEWRIRSVRSGFFAVQQLLDFFKHGLYIAKRAIDAGETDVGDLIQTPQVFHHQFADLAALDFLAPKPVEFLLDLLYGAFDLTYRQGSFFASFTNTDIDFLAIKILAALIAFNDYQVEFFYTFVGTESPFALLALAPSVNGVANIARVFDARFCASAKRTLHKLLRLKN